MPRDVLEIGLFLIESESPMRAVMLGVTRDPQLCELVRDAIAAARSGEADRLRRLAPRRPDREPVQ